MKKIIPQNNTFNQFLLYKTPEGKVKVEIFLHNENIWLSQKLIGQLFDCSTDNVSLHLKNIFQTGELQESAVTEEFSVTASDGKNYKTKFYNLDAIISVGYRINSQSATNFRIWATERLREYIIKGFTMDDERLKDPNYFFGKDYFEEQLERIKVIRTSERRFYQKITDIYAECSADYDKNSAEAQNFFATVQNKLHFAITHLTAAEIIHLRVGSKKANMGLTNWKNGPHGAIRKTDISIAKNYLDQNELDNLNSVVEMYLVFATSQAKNRRAMFMQDWEKKLNEFLKLNDRDILDNLGNVSHDLALSLAEKEFEKYSVDQDKKNISDFDEYLEKATVKKKLSVQKPKK